MNLHDLQLPIRIFVKLSDVIDALVEERGLGKAILSNIVCEGLLAAYQKRYPELILQATYNDRSGLLALEVQKEVVSSVEDEEVQISLRKMRAIDPHVAVGDKVWVPFEGSIGRIEIIRAKQLISSRIKEIEAAAVYSEFKDRQGSILQGIVHKQEFGGVSIKIHDHLAFLPRSLSIPDEKFPVGHPVRALLKEVLEQPRNENQLILDRASEDFLICLFELEIPEVYERLVEVKKAVRIAGYKSKVIVVSHDSNIDPVGTCVGVGGARIKPILKELGNEKIDIIAATDSMEKLVRSALKPAEINRVEISDDGLSARIWLDEDQRSLAIGKMGQNIMLASRLTGLDIQLVPVEKREAIDQKFEEEL